LHSQRYDLPPSLVHFKCNDPLGLTRQSYWPPVIDRWPVLFQPRSATPGVHHQITKYLCRVAAVPKEYFRRASIPVSIPI